MMRVLQTLAFPLGHDAVLADSRWQIANGFRLTIRYLPLAICQPERAMGFEPTTFSLARRRSTAELRPQLFLLTGRVCRESESN